jgi:hypothetical protein
MSDRVDAAASEPERSGAQASPSSATRGSDSSAPPESNTIKDPDDWTTGDEPATGAQESYLHTLAAEAHEDVPEGLSKADASRKIDELQAKTGRGR